MLNPYAAITFSKYAEDSFVLHIMIKCVFVCLHPNYRTTEPEKDAVWILTLAGGLYR